MSGDEPHQPLDVRAASPALLVKPGSIARHVEEATGDRGHAFDLVAVRALLADPEVQARMKRMDETALLPVRR